MALEEPHARLEPRLASARRRAALAIGWERLWPLLVPALCVVGLFLSVSWFGIWPELPNVVRWIVLAGFVGALGFALRLLRGFSWPDHEAVDQRIEQTSLLRHRPVTAQADDQADLAERQGH